MTKLSAIVFDLDQTLFDRQRSLNDWISSLSLCHRDQNLLRRLDQNGYGNREKFFAAYESITGMGIDHQRFVFSLIQFLHPDRSLINCLKRLQAAFSIAILSNGGVWTQQTKVRLLSLDEVFSPDRIFVSAEIGFAKPDPRAFDWVANSLGVLASDCLYFGDSMQTDVEAARDAGWTARHVRGPNELMGHLTQLVGRVEC